MKFMSTVFIRLVSERLSLFRYVSTVKQPVPGKEQKQNKMIAKETNSFVSNMFKGQLNTDQIFPYPEILSHDERNTLQLLTDVSKKFFEEVNDSDKNDDLAKIPEPLMKALSELGVFGLQIPEEHGGLGLNNTQYARMVELVGRHDLAVGITLGAHQSIGFKGIMLFGNDAQKKKYLPNLATGKTIAAFCLTEPGSGSDASSIKTKAILSEDGKYFTMNGSKLWISNGGISEIFTVFAKVPVKTEKGTHERMSAFIVERKFGGVTSGPAEKKMGIRASNTAEVFFEDVKVPAENLIGKVGDGFKIAMNILNNGRFGTAALLAGTMRAAIEKATDFASNRIQFGHKISTYGAVQEKLLRMCMSQYITESMAYMISGNMDQGCLDFQLEAAISKVFASESACYVVDEAVQVMGGMGFMRSAGLERVLRDVRIFRIFEGTNDILRFFIALTGLQHTGSRLKELEKALKNPTGNPILVLTEIFERIRRTFGLSGQFSLSGRVHSNLDESAILLSKCIGLFGLSADELLIKYGEDIINQQFLLNKLANSAIDIYAMVTVLSRATLSIKKKIPSAEYEEMLARLICSEASERVYMNLGILKSETKIKHFQLMRLIAENIVIVGGPIQQNPLGL